MEKLRKMDWILFVAVILLFCLGLSAIYSVSLSNVDHNLDNFKKQIVFGFLGVLLMMLMAVRNYHALRVYSKTIYVFSLISLILVLMFGTVINGTKGWFNIFGVGIQPVELAKISLIVTLSKFFSNRLQQLNISKHLIVSFVLTILFVAFVMMQPDLGSSLVLLGTWFLLLVLSGLPRKYLIALVAIILIFSIVSWNFLLVDYQKDRIMIFLDPSIDPLGAGYNVTQAIIAIGSGGFFGRGLGFGSQSQLKFIPESQTDFLFAVIAEELGFFGVFLVLGFWSLLFYRLIVIAKNAKDDFGMYLVLGVICVLFIHFFINIGMNMGIMPVTGISLPFLSYGGSFLMVAMFLIGIAQSVAIRK